MAYRIITQVVIVGSRILGRSFMAAYKQAQAASNYQRAQSKLNPNGAASATGRASLATGMTLEEACKILNVKPPQGGKANLEEVMERYKRLFDSNDPKKGGSFYLQSKIVRARERIEGEVQPLAEQEAVKAETGGEGLPKMYKDR